MGEISTYAKKTCRIHYDLRGEQRPGLVSVDEELCMCNNISNGYWCNIL